MRIRKEQCSAIISARWAELIGVTRSASEILKDGMPRTSDNKFSDLAASLRGKTLPHQYTSAPPTKIVPCPAPGSPAAFLPRKPQHYPCLECLYRHQTVISVLHATKPLGEGYGPGMTTNGEGCGPVGRVVRW